MLISRGFGMVSPESPQLGLEHRGIYRPHPLRAAGDRSGIQPEGQWPLGVAVEAGPLSGFGATDQAGMERVALDISHDHQATVDQYRRRGRKGNIVTCNREMHKIGKKLRVRFPRLGRPSSSKA